MEQIIQLYNQEAAESILARLSFEKESIEDNEYFVVWFSNTLGLDTEQEQMIRERLGIPEGRFAGLQRRIQTMERYTQPTMLGENK